MTDAALYPIMNEIRSNMEKLGIKCSHNVTKIKFTGQRRSWGKCHRRDDRYWISISDQLGKKGVNKNALESVIAHELLHTCPKCWCHTGEFERLAIVLEEKYGYKIRAHDRKEFEIPDDIYYDEPYVIQCTECGQKYAYNKRRKWFKVLDQCKCGSCRKQTLKFIKGGY